ncbi:metallophosphatase family protein [Rhodocaloribacter litoris]|uniref:metallophosphoesterase family protein n=1 Tax=Rhodocaloribacter litoris TaxID=2558931 RepID=UPI001422A950|nr:metallophosphoesterase family protein [Rhodocaloribacter litoris]QXD16643.1 metallophosphatase family protein [Rhodocaloribacter litoris]GIV59358.1 MAG: metallophosphatase family protein [Rhodothermaceae bacterium]
MKLALISDIHSNLPALETALACIDEYGADAIYCLGDVVGYGADAAGCVALVRERCAGVVLGNHDEAVALERGLEYLPKEAQIAALHNRAQLSEEQRQYLAGLPLRLEVHGCTFVHATPFQPEAWIRLDTYQTAQLQFEHFTTDVCFLGHTHIPAVMSNRLGVLRVRRGHRFLINVGSVGQPRDGNPRLCVAFFDTETFAYELLRLPYDVERAAARIEAEGLPTSLARRLKLGR